MKMIRPWAACLLATALAGCGGGGDDNPPAVAAARESSGSSVHPNGATAQSNDIPVQTNGEPAQSTAPTQAGTAATQFSLRRSQQGDERTYEMVERYSDATTLIYSRRTVQTVLNPDGSGQRQVFNGNHALIETETRSYDEAGRLSRHFASTDVTCKYDAQRNSFTSPLSIGQTFESNLIETCDNGFSTAIAEKGTIVASETVMINGTSYNTLKAIITEHGLVTPPLPESGYAYSVTRTEWIEPTLGLQVKEDAASTLDAPPGALYRTSRSTRLMSYLNM